MHPSQLCRHPSKLRPPALRSIKDQIETGSCDDNHDDHRDMMQTLMIIMIKDKIKLDDGGCQDDACKP